ncbi:helix-turn-helix domain-containing protein [Kitasatospora sp. NPDC058046]|uniref:helix-turn-helix domain-containing protein n=1 Tax=Kitasatospora sp. NPDC058046 TaxID=3346312 RepID=UPI0036D8EBDE
MDASRLLGQPEFGRQLRQLRVSRGLSQADLAGEGISKAQISRLESGLRPPTERTIAYLAERLDVTPEAFRFGNTEILTLAEALAAVTSAVDREHALDRLRDVLHDQPEADPTLRWHALWLLGERNDDERGLLVELVALAEEIDQPTLRARTHARLARFLRSQGDLDAALTAADRAMAEIDGRPTSPADTASLLLALVSIEVESNNGGSAAKYAASLHSLLPRLPYLLRTEALWTLAAYRIYEQHYEEGRAALEEAMETLSSKDNLILWMRLRLAAARLYMIESVDLGQARRRLAEVGPAIELIGHTRHQHEFLTMTARLAYLEGDLDRAEELIRGTDPLGLDLDYPDRMRHLALIAQVKLARGDESGGTDLVELAQEAEARKNFKLSSEIWKARATTRRA